MRSWTFALLVLAACGVDAPPVRPAVGRARQAIIGGVTDPSHPYVVMVGDTSGGFCSGTLISSHVVITAGHCWGSGSDAITRVFFETGPNLTESTLVVQTSVRHPGYDDFSLAHDLAMVELASAAPVQAVPLLRETLDSSFIGPKFTFVGYGDTNTFGTGFGTRRVVTFPINLIGPQANIPLPGNAPASASDAIDSSQFYYRILGKNTCTGDSGGPAFVVRGQVERHAGVTSFGDDECAWDGVVARTDATTMAWIQGNIDAMENGGACRSDGTCNDTCVSSTPAPLGALRDPDCADQHCAADGVCSLACSPLDPDCASVAVNNCHDNGICQPGCSTPDLDCPLGTGGAARAVSGGAGGAGGGTTGTGGGGAMGGGQGGSGGGGGTIDDPHKPCGCTAAPWPMLGLAALALLSTRRRSRS